MNTSDQAQDASQGNGAQAGTQQYVARGSMEAQEGGTAGQETGGQVRRSNMGVLRPPVDVIEDMQGITLIADMPGVSREHLNLRLEAQSLTIEGALSLDLPQDMDSRYAEVRHQHYERTFALSRELDGESATAELKHGVLRVRIPKTQAAVPRKIPVNVAQG